MPPRQESDPHQRLRRALLYPLSYEGLIILILSQKSDSLKGKAESSVTVARNFWEVVVRVQIPALRQK